jgi:asparagine synthase (glutamine-hydrolysing)
MCGIAGIAAMNGGPVDPVPMASMLSCLRHRGPDDEGMYVADQIVLGHRRLSIIDVEGGHQPLFGQRSSTVAVVNGEIYNYRALRSQLTAAGSVFRTSSDSEVAAHAYDRWGPECIDRLDGMFALALWDGAERRLLLARDRMGEKPLFYTRVDDLLIFASELTGVLAHPAVDATLDHRALREYLALEYVPAPRSIIAGVSKLEPGCMLVVERGAARVRRYWSIDPRTAQPEPSYPDAVSTLRVRLDEAVRSRLISDVPLGVFLSGGLDSSAIAALAARHGALDTFSIGFEEQSFDESGHARAVARHIGSRHHERIVRPTEMPDLVPGLGSMLDEPIGDASILPTAVLSSFAREHVTVALGGDGGDELFGGYPMHQAHRVAPLFRVMPRAVTASLARGAALLPVSHRNFAFAFKAATFLRGAPLASPINHAMWMTSFPPGAQHELLQEDVLRDSVDIDPFEAMHDAWAASAGAPPLARAAHLDAVTYLPNDILVKVDRASMAVALEVRAPFLAREVVQYAFALPDTHRMRRLTGKRVLRDAVADLLPDSILRRPKKGFGMPVAAWLNGALRPLVNDVLGADSLAAAGLFRPDTVQRMIREHERRERDHRKQLWTLLVLELWRRRHIEAASSAHSAGTAR